MIEDIQKTRKTILLEENTRSTPRRVLPDMRARRLSAIEIAEGALLANIGVVSQLLIQILPVGGNAIALMIPVVFAVLVLRRGLYVGCMSLCVTLFMIIIVLGPAVVPIMVLEAGAGLFLGMTMRHRLRHFTTISLGIICGALAFWSVLLLTSYLSGGPGFLIHLMRQSYAAFTPLLGQAFELIGREGTWQHTLLPRLNSFMQWGLQHWLLLLYLGACLLCIPIVTAVYLITNFFLRLLGYQVRPFPGYRLEGMLNRCAQLLFRLIPRRVFIRSHWLHNLKVEVRRLNIARLRQHRLEKEVEDR
ncbi:MAG TPA: DUF2232 domain-containing protein [Ktedonobacteraceae bacterium]|nr:DUF2232 domain-containing protein [Ktedonobacteraceae bacterium]